ncbi:hypothetical protein MHYP_G00281950 [Metynnis hypsauchen]
MRPEEKSKAISIILEQYLKLMNPDLRTWIIECNPQSMAMAAELAEAYNAARQAEREFRDDDSWMTAQKSIFIHGSYGDRQQLKNCRSGTKKFHTWIMWRQTATEELQKWHQKRKSPVS